MIRKNDFWKAVSYAVSSVHPVM